MEETQQGDWFGRNKRSDIRLIERAARAGWNIPERMYEKAPEILAQIAETSDSEVTRIRAIAGLSVMHGQNEKQAEEQTKEAGAVNVTVNQYASDGGTITNGNKAALDAASDFIAFMANDEGERGGVGVVRDAGEVPSTATPETPEPEAS